MSGSGPFAPIVHGVWQSWQPEVVTRYSPRATLTLVVVFMEVAAGVLAETASVVTKMPAQTAVIAVNRLVVIMLSPSHTDGDERRPNPNHLLQVH